MLSGTLSNPKTSNGHTIAPSIDMHQQYGSQPLHNIYPPLLLAPIHPTEHLMMPAANGQFYLSAVARLSHQQSYHAQQQKQNQQQPHQQYSHNNKFVHQQQQQLPPPERQQQQALPSHNNHSHHNSPHQQAFSEGMDSSEIDLSHSHGGLDAYAISQLQIMAQSQQQEHHHHNAHASFSNSLPIRYPIPSHLAAPPSVTAFDQERLRALQENNNLMRYDLELKRLEKLMDRAVITQKPQQYVDQLQELIDMHLDKGVPPPNSG